MQHENMTNEDTNNLQIKQTTKPMKDLKDLVFAFSTDKVNIKPSSQTYNEAYSIFQIVDKIKNGRPPSFYSQIAKTMVTAYNGKNQTKEYLKQEKAKGTRLKLMLPYYLFSGFQTKGHGVHKPKAKTDGDTAHSDNVDSDRVLAYNGCIQIDLDFKEKGGNEKAAMYNEKMSKLPYVILSGISPSGVGVKALVRTDNLDKALHVSAANKVFAKLQHDMDTKSKFDSLGASQPCYTFYDKNLYFNPDAEIFVCGELELDEKNDSSNKNNRSNKSNRSNKTNVSADKNVPLKDITKSASYVNDKVEIFTKERIENLLDISYYSAKKVRGEHVGTEFLQSFCGSTIKFGIGTADLVAYMLKKGHSDITSMKREYTITDLYERYNYNFGTVDFSHEIEDFMDIDRVAPVVVDSVAPPVVDSVKDGIVKENVEVVNNKAKKDNTEIVESFKPNAFYTLGANQKLSDIDLDLSENSIVISPTGTGKSYYIGNKLTMMRIMVVPTKILVQQFAKEYDASPYYQDEKKLKNKDFIVTTYSSLENLCKQIDASEYTLFIDEAHNTTSSTSPSYLLKQLNQVIDLVPTFKSYHLLTATPLFNFHPAIIGLRKLKVSKAVQCEKTVRQVRCVDFYKTLKVEVSKSVNDGNQYAILSNNTKDEGRLGKIKGALIGYKNVIINSTMKDEDSFVKVAIEGDMTDFQGVISTSIMKEGNSITKHSDTINVFVDGAFHPCEIEQFCSRFRNAKNINLTFLKNADIKHKYTTFNETEARVELMELVEAHKVFIESIQASKHMIKEQFRLMSFLGKSYFRTDSEEIVLDHLSLSHILFVEQRSAANGDYTYMTTYLEQFEWENKGIITIKEKMTTEEKVLMTQITEAAKDSHAARVTEVFENVMHNRTEYNSDLVDMNYGDVVESDIRFKLDVLANIMKESSLEKPCVYLKGLGLTKNAWSIFMQGYNIKKIRDHVGFEKNKSIVAVFIREIYEAIEVGGTYSSDEIEVLINVVMVRLFKTKLTKIKITKLLKSFFEIKKFTTTKNKVSVKRYEVLTDNPTKLNFEDKKITTSTLKTEAPTKEDLKDESFAALINFLSK